MEDRGPRNAENFEEMKVSKFKTVLGTFCTGLPSLKKASKCQAIHGIILSFLLTIVPPFVGVVFGAASLVVAILLLIYSLLLLRSVLDNHGARVFKIIKIGCLILLYLQLITKLMIFVGLVTLLADPFRYPIQTEGGIVFLVNLLDLFLTSVTIYAIHSAKPKIVSLYIYIMATISIIIASLFVIALILILIVAFFGDDLGGFPAYLQSIGAVLFETVPGLTVLLIIILSFVVILVALIMDYYLKIFALHVNMMNIAAVNNNLHHQELIDF